MDFIREPRLPPPALSHEEVAVQQPPPLPRSAPVHPLARIMPLAMAVAAVGMIVVYATSGTGSMRTPAFAFFPVMMLGSVVGTLAYGARGSGVRSEIDADRGAYLRYLDMLDGEVRDTVEHQGRFARWTHPDPDELWTLAGSRRMWERRPEDADFCEVRVGRGDQGLCTPLIAPDFDAADESDPVTVAAVRRLIAQRSVVPDLPISVALQRGSTITIRGDVDEARALARAMICQLSTFHGPDDIAIAVAVGPSTRAEWEWLKWLPHHQDSQHGRRCVVVRDGGSSTAQEDAAVLDVCPAAGALMIQLGGGDVRGIAHYDGLTPGAAIRCARRLAPYRPAASDAAQRGWLGLMKIGDPAVLEPDERWAARVGGRLSPVPVGVSEEGKPVVLDINEAARGGVGPHGLCIGATGSGKSEFLRTLALGMITMHPPDALNLILVDFKGGATFLGFERARHVAAVITNLADEAHLVSRMNEALSGELNRRQELLRTAGSFANLHAYEKARSAGAPLPALPALFILVDEFSELLSRHPEFADLFVAIGRLGRSLGIHLLLASQRLDEGRLRGLETHLSYRICLKTFSAAESRAVLGVPDAYHLPATPGAAYLTTAPGDLVGLRTAFVSSPAEATRRDPTLVRPMLFTRQGAVAHESPPAESARTVLDAVLDRLAGRGTDAHRVWLPPITESPTLDLLPRAVGRLTAAIGLVDNPFHQRQDPLVVDLSGAAGNTAIIGAAQAGKSSALCTLLLALAETHDPIDVSFYCLDFGGGALSSLRGVPHVGSVARPDEPDLCRRTVAVVESILRQRETRADGPGGDVFLVVDGWTTLRQQFDGIEASVTAIATRGLSHGVHVVLTASRWADLRPALKDQIATRIELRLGEPAESEMDRRSARQLTGRPAGRGITVAGHEMVIAVPSAVDAQVARLQERWQGRHAPTVELLPARVAHADLVGPIGNPRPGQCILGLGERELTPVTIDFAEHPHLLILGETGCGKSATLRTLCREIVRTASADQAQLEILDLRRSLLGVVESAHYAMSPAALTSRVRSISETLAARMPGEDVTQRQLRERSWWSGPDIYLVIDDYDLAAAVTGNPLTPLADFLPHATDLGLHVIVGRRSGGAARAMFDPVLARLRELGCMGLMMSASPEEGVLLGTVRPSSLPSGRGTLVVRGDAEQVVQVGWTDPP